MLIAQRWTGPLVVALLVVVVTLVVAPKTASAAPENISSLAARACREQGYLKYVHADATPFANPGACVNYATKTGMLLVQYPYAFGADHTMNCFVLYDEITLQLAYLGGSNSNDEYTLTCGLSASDPFRFISSLTMAPGEAEIIPVLQLDIVGQWYWDDGDQMFVPGWPVGMHSGAFRA
jgi:hypothetical protein